jgi:hypothetical protein
MAGLPLPCRPSQVGSKAIKPTMSAARATAGGGLLDLIASASTSWSTRAVRLAGSGHPEATSPSCVGRPPDDEVAQERVDVAPLRPGSAAMLAAV